MQSIKFDGFEHWPGLRNELLAYINEFCGQMTLAQAKDWFDEAFTRMPSDRP
jgi:hypothetical protein